MAFAHQGIFPEKILLELLSQPGKKERIKLMKSGAEEFLNWVKDLFNKGLPQLLNTGHFELEKIAARLVDTKNSTLARELRMIGADLDTLNWSEKKCVDQLLRLYFLAKALKNMDGLPLLLQSELLQICGMSWRKKELEWIPPLSDQWLCLHEEENWRENLRVSQSWFYGIKSSVFFEYNQYAFRFAPFDHPVQGGKVYTGNVKYYPSVVPLQGFPSDGFLAGASASGKEKPKFSNPIETIIKLRAQHPLRMNWPMILPSAAFDKSSGFLQKLSGNQKNNALKLLLNFSSLDPELRVFGLWSPSGFLPKSLFNERDTVPLQKWTE